MDGCENLQVNECFLARVKIYTSLAIKNKCDFSITHPGRRISNGFSILILRSVGRSCGTLPMNLLMRLRPSGRALLPKVGEHSFSRGNLLVEDGAGVLGGEMICRRIIEICLSLSTVFRC